MLRYIFSLRPSKIGDTLRASTCAGTAGLEGLRVSRDFLRLYRIAAEIATRCECWRKSYRRSSRQRLELVRHEGRQERRNDDGFFDLGWSCNEYARCGSIDPGVVLHLLQQRGMSVEEVVQMLYNEAGMLGVSGVSGDMQALIESDEPSAKEAVDLFVYRAGREIGSMAAALSGLDTLVFCAGIGENSPLIRQRIGEAARWLGVEIDAQRNWRGDERISASHSAVEVLVIPTDEEKAVAVELMKLPSETLSASRANV